MEEKTVYRSLRSRYFIAPSEAETKETSPTVNSIDLQTGEVLRGPLVKLAVSHCGAFSKLSVLALGLVSILNCSTALGCGVFVASLPTRNFPVSSSTTSSSVWRERCKKQFFV